ncbi:MAG TPA: sodium/solute symporter [Tepidisphaeraceae bacterium]|nr:sodium/solute symporter [Tepidisphaeraceae bacterium]
MSIWRLAIALGLLVSVLATGVVRGQSEQGFRAEPLPALPREMDGAVLGTHGGALFVVGGTYRDEAGNEVTSNQILALPPKAAGWTVAGELDLASAATAAASTPDGVVVIGGADVTLLSWSNDRLGQRTLPALPNPIARGAATSLGRTVFVAAGDAGTFQSLDLGAKTPAWKQLAALPGPAEIESPALVGLMDVVYLFGSVDEKPVAYAYTPRTGWSERAPPPRWHAGAADAAVAYGHAHIFVFAAAEGRDVPTYHTITNTWLSIPLPEPLPAGATPIAVASGKQSFLLTGAQVMSVAPKPIETNYGWWDHAVVAIYLIGMVAMGWYFAGREKNTQDYFRGGKRIPWWATGMSLFATGSSAISLMSMPGKAYQANWAYFSISIFSLVALPVSIYVLAPLVRRLNIATANEYLERRFGVTARLFASSIYCFTQLCGRMAPVMLLPSIALSAITGIDITVSILIMGLITTIYTFLGGLEAVVWTDTVQGLIMCAAVAGCLLLALVKLSTGPAEIWSAAESANKLHVLDWSFDATYPVVWMFAISTIVLTLGNIGDQNFVQRVQCTPTLRDAKKAVATQLAVAVPINVLLFALGTALWLFYRGRPEQLNPTMETDGIFPFFVAQQLPPGVSGLVVAALLAATMSTISSSICAVADLGVNDFYRRFSRRATDRSSFLLGRVLMGAVGVLGTGIAILLGQLGAASVWDLALLVTGLISNGIIGLFWVGLLTKRAHQTGVLLGVVCGMVTVVLFQQNTPVHFLWYQTIGAVVTVVTGYVFSVILPGRVGDLTGLTIFTLPKRNATDDAPSAPPPEGLATPPAAAPTGPIG